MTTGSTVLKNKMEVTVTAEEIGKRSALIQTTSISPRRTVHPSILGLGHDRLLGPSITKANELVEAVVDTSAGVLTTTATMPIRGGQEVEMITMTETEVTNRRHDDTERCTGTTDKGTNVICS